MRYANLSPFIALSLLLHAILLFSFTRGPERPPLRLVVAPVKLFEQTPRLQGAAPDHLASVMERMSVAPSQTEPALGETTPAVLPEIDLPATGVIPITEQKPAWLAARDSVHLLRRPAQTGELPRAVDPVELDALAREHTIAIVDPLTQKLKKAWLHLPVYANSSGAVEMTRFLDLAARGFRVPHPLPLEGVMRYAHLGEPSPTWIDIEGLPGPNPFHRYVLHFERHILPYEEMRKYPLLVLRYMDVESAAAMARYLREGGFGVVSRGQLAQLQRLLPESEQIPVELEHPLFRAFFDINTYEEPNDHGCGLPRQQTPPCAGISPLASLQLNGRLVALAGLPPFNDQCNCPANKLFVNILAYALVQPSPMGGRYLAVD